MIPLSNHPVLACDSLKAFHCVDSWSSQSEILVLCAPAATYSAKSNGQSHVQVHVFSPAGLQSYQRLLISPSSLLYGAVRCLARTEQGDEVCRVLAYGLFKYFHELSDEDRQTWMRRSVSGNRPSSAHQLFTETHAANLASQMVQIHDPGSLVTRLKLALDPQQITHLDIDLQLPKGTLQTDIAESDPKFARHNDTDFCAPSSLYSRLISLFGSETPLHGTTHTSPTTTLHGGTKDFGGREQLSLRQHFLELLRTEVSYVVKLGSVLEQVWGNDALTGVPTLPSTHGSHVCDTFSRILHDVRTVNVGFLNSCQHILGRREESPDTYQVDSEERWAKCCDASDILSVIDQLAEVFHDWLPRFAIAYKDYIQQFTQSSQAFRLAVAQSGMDIAMNARYYGEQRLMSALIEPIQRLPRYIMLIDSMMTCLPRQRDSLKRLLQAKDALGCICNHSSLTNTAASPVCRLRDCVINWPESVLPNGRFISATRLVEASTLDAFVQGINSCRRLVAVLFSGTLIMLQSDQHCAEDDRNITERIERMLMSDARHPSQVDPPIKGLYFLANVSLTDVSFTTQANSLIIKMFSTTMKPKCASKSPVDSSVSYTTDIAFKLPEDSREQTMHWLRAIVRARVEGRFHEAQRLGSSLHLRETEIEPDLVFVTALYEGNDPAQPIGPVTCKVAIDLEGEDVNTCAGPKNSSDILISLRTLDDSHCRLETSLKDESMFCDLVIITELLPTLIKRLTSILQLQYERRHLMAPAQRFQHNERILQFLNITPSNRGRASPKVRSLRQQSQSPVKALAQLLSASSTRSALERKISPTNETPDPYQRQSMAQSEHVSISTHDQKSADLDFQAFNAVSTDVLEQTLTTFVTAISARKGNIVGRSVSERRKAEASAVINLTASLIKDPSDYERAAQEQVDVLFAAFELFLVKQWKEHCGEVLSSSLLRELQENSHTLLKSQYEGLLSHTLTKLSPSNRKALDAVVTLAVELLGGMGNDNDRGALVAGVTEMLIQDGCAHEFIPMFDQFIDDRTSSLARLRLEKGFLPEGEITLTRTGETKSSAFLSHKTSSLSKRLGRSNNRAEHWKGDQTLGVGGILRTWSKTTRAGEARKPFLDRTHSVDTSTLQSISRPRSHDRQTGPHEPSTMQRNTAIDSGQSNAQSHECLADIYSGHKRRSSLSDLPRLPLPNTSPLWRTPTGRTPTLESSPTRRGGVLDSGKHSVPLSSPSLVPLHYRQLAMVNTGCRLEVGNVMTKTEGTMNNGNATVVPQEGQAHEVLPLEQALSNVAPRGILTERTNLGNGGRRASSRNPHEKGDGDVKVHAKADKYIQKDILETFLNDISQAKSHLQADFDLFRETKFQTPLQGFENSVRFEPRLADRNGQAPALNTLFEDLKSRVQCRLDDLSLKVESALTGFTASKTSSCKASEDKIKALERQLRIKDAENDALYKRSNEELQKTFKQVKDGNGVEELRQKLKQSQEEGLKWKRENERLRKHQGR